jgi:hypothetical protein
MGLAAEKRGDECNGRECREDGEYGDIRGRRVNLCAFGYDHPVPEHSFLNYIKRQKYLNRITGFSGFIEFILSCQFYYVFVYSLTSEL